MKIAIMQPYFFPYVGYFQLISSVDKFVIYDDVNYIKGGWINRNNLLIGNKKTLFTIPLKGSSSFVMIKDIYLDDKQYSKWVAKFFKSLYQSYRKAPFFDAGSTLINDIFKSASPDMSISDLNFNAISEICNYLSIKTALSKSSGVYNNESLNGQQRVLDICKKERANIYINAIGGMELYSREDFAKNNIKLQFLKSQQVVYHQFSPQFEPGLSIIDVIMFNSVEDILRLLPAYELV